jgi:hypothetical protein
VGPTNHSSIIRGVYTTQRTVAPCKTMLSYLWGLDMMMPQDWIIGSHRIAGGRTGERRATYDSSGMDGIVLFAFAFVCLFVCF